MKSGPDCRRPAELFRLAVAIAVESIEVAAPHLSGLWRCHLQIGERDTRFHRPTPIAIARILHSTVDLHGVGHRGRGVRPVPFELLGAAVGAEHVGDDGVECAAERIPLQLEITVERGWCDEKLDDFLFPEAAVPLRKGGLNIAVLHHPPEIQRRFVVQNAHFSVHAGRCHGVVVDERREPRRLLPHRLIKSPVDLDDSLDARNGCRFRLRQRR
jgi:hypothetical protein